MSEAAVFPRHLLERDPRAQDARDWARLIVASVARGLVVTILGLAFWAAAPALIGWHPTTVMTGSMMPRIHPGDVVVAVPLPPAEVKLGKVILFEDPAHPGELRLHRYVERGDDGTLITKGDANAQNDSTPVMPAAVRGVAVLRVPWLGLPILWIREGKWLLVGLVVMAVVLLVGLGGIDRGLRVGRPDPARETMRWRALHVKRLRAAGAAAALLIAVVAATSVVPLPALGAPFGATTSNPSSSFTAATAQAVTALTCANNSDGSTVTIGWTYPATGATPATFSLLYNGTVEATALGTATSLVLSQTSLLNLGSTYALNLRTDLVAGNIVWTATSTVTVSVKVTALLGATSVRCA